MYNLTSVDEKVSYFGKVVAFNQEVSYIIFVLVMVAIFIIALVASYKRLEDFSKSAFFAGLGSTIISGLLWGAKSLPDQVPIFFAIITLIALFMTIMKSR